MSVQSGFILIDKPPGISSQSVVSHIKKKLKADRVGHLGTLDPFASGLLPIVIGGATRLADLVMQKKKSYLFTVELGKETDTLDTEGVIINTLPIPENWMVKLSEVIPQFTGDVIQVPPAYSALKVDGKPLYEYMRKTGSLPVDIKDKTRTVKIQSLEILKFEDGETCRATLRATCSTGTYIRSLARDLAAAIGTCGYCVLLRRETVDNWDVKNALLFDRNLEPAILESAMQHPFELTPALVRLAIDEKYEQAISNGNTILMPKAENRTFGSPLFIYTKNFAFLAEAELVGSEIKLQPRKRII